MAAITVNRDGLKSSWPRSAEVHGSTSTQTKQAGNRNRLKRFCLGYLQCTYFWVCRCVALHRQTVLRANRMLTHGGSDRMSPIVPAGMINITNEIQLLPTFWRRS